MFNLILAIHVVVAIAVIAVILIQRGRSGGLVEALGGVESIFGTKTSALFIKITVVLAILFFVTSISLAYISKQRGRSLMDIYQDREGPSQVITLPEKEVDAVSEKSVELETPLENIPETESELEPEPGI